MRTRHFALSAALAAVAVAPAFAADDRISDIRALIGVWPEKYEADNLDAGVNSAYRVAGQYMRSLHELTDVGGLIYGGEGSFTVASGDNIDSTALAIDGHLGWAYMLHDRPQIHFEGTAFLGIGLETVDNGGGNDIGPMIEYGIRGAGFYTFDNNWQVGLDLRYLINSSSSQDIGQGKFDYDNHGLALLLAVGKRM